MTTDHSSHPTPAEAAPGGPLTVVVDLARQGSAAPPALELRGSLDPHRIEAALDRLDRLTARPGRNRHPRLRRAGPGHHTLRLTPPGGGHTGHDPFPTGLLADLLTVEPTGPGPVTRIEPTGLQRELLTDADAHPGTEGACEQLALTWRGPLDPGRFTTAWQSVAAHESVLRAAFEDGPQPWIVCHDHTGPEILRFPHGSVHWSALTEADRRRGLDPRRGGPLRVTVLDGPDGGPETALSALVLLSFHPALLDDWSVRLLLHEFYRAYLADGTLSGGERRPDLRDYARWLAAQDPAPAKEFWQAAPPGPATEPAPGAGPHESTGQVRARLTPGQSERLRAWAAGRGCPESSALHAVWALALYRASARSGPSSIRFSTTVSGRGVLLDGIERLPSALRNPLPVTAAVDPAAPLTALLAGLRDQALDLAAYEWVPQGRIRSWTRPGAAGPPSRNPARTGTLVVFEYRPHPPADLTPGLAAMGIRVSAPETLGVRTAFPLTLVAHRDDAGGIVLTASCAGTPLADAQDLLTYTAAALRELPHTATPSTTVGDLIGLPPAPGRTPPGAPRGPGPAHRSPPAQLRPAARPGVGTVCLVRAPGTPLSSLTRVAYAYEGPEAVVLLRPPPAGQPALRTLTGIEGPVVLGAFCGGGQTAYEIAQALAATGGRPPAVVITATASPAAAFARILQAVARRTR